jgi:hypothetical protein
MKYNNYDKNEDDIIVKCREIATEYDTKCLEVLIRYSIERDKIISKDPGKPDNFYEAMTFQAVREFYRKDTGGK